MLYARDCQNHDVVGIRLQLARHIKRHVDHIVFRITVPAEERLAFFEDADDAKLIAADTEILPNWGTVGKKVFTNGRADYAHCLVVVVFKLRKEPALFGDMGAGAFEVWQGTV